MDEDGSVLNDAPRIYFPGPVPPHEWREEYYQFVTVSGSMEWRKPKLTFHGKGADTLREKVRMALEIYWKNQPNCYVVDPWVREKSE